MKKDFRERLSEGTLISDGAMGTEIYRRGIFINQCYDYLNITKPDFIKRIHREYIDAGAEIIETNTFGANRLKLLGYGLEDKVREINIQGVQIAKEVAGNEVYVAGSIGPLGKELKPIGLIDEKDAEEIFKEQIDALLEGEVDLLLFETFTSLKELEIAYKTARKISDLPIIVQVSFRYYGSNSFAGITPEEAACRMSEWNIDVMGTNCGNGPKGVYDCVTRMIPHAKDKMISAMPNAGLPEMVKGRMIYMTTPEYFSEYSRRMVLKGVRIIGGCCGTTPAHINEMKKFIRSITPKITTVTMEWKEQKQALKPLSIEQRSNFGRMLNDHEKFIICVEIDPPHGLSANKEIDAVKTLIEHGVDAVNLSDGPRAMPRMSPLALAIILKEKTGIDVIVHYTCRDRNLLGIQMDLIGSHALGIRNILAITGDPPKMGDYPDASAVFDIDSIGLIHLIQNLNRGLDFAGKPLGEKTSFVVGAGCNPGAVNPEVEIERLERKVKAGAEFIFTQPIYESETFEKFLKRTEHLSHIPLIVGVLPLASYRNAEFLNNEVPGMQIPKDIMERMAKASTKEAQRKEGIKIAQEILLHLRKHPRVKGVYIFPPFGKYQSVLEVLKVL